MLNIKHFGGLSLKAKTKFKFSKNEKKGDPPPHFGIKTNLTFQTLKGKKGHHHPAMGLVSGC